MDHFEYLMGLARPVLFNNEYEEFPYSSHGSCVILCYRGQIYGLTAKHVIGAYEAHQVMLPYEAGSHEHLPFEDAGIIETDIEDDTDHKDLAVFTVCRERLNVENLRPETVFDLNGNRFQSRTPRSKYFIAGFPNELNDVQYENQLISQQGLVIPVELVQEHRFYGVDQIRFLNSGDLCSFQGFSGAGVFSITPTQEGRGNLRFEGVMVKGSRESMLGYLIRYDVIEGYLESIRIENSTSQQ
ncbi:MAG: hypothetical protein QM755_21845 [Luteolibacter sp.]